MPEGSDFNPHDGLSPSELAAMRDGFCFCSPSQERIPMLAEMRAQFRALRDHILETVPNCRLRAEGITHLEDASHWIIKALVFTDPDADMVEG